MGGPACLSVPCPKPVKQRLTDRGDHVRQPRQGGLCRGVARGGAGTYAAGGWAGWLGPRLDPSAW